MADDHQPAEVEAVLALHLLLLIIFFLHFLFHGL